MVSEVVARSVGALGMAWVRRALKDGHELSEAVLRSTSLEIGDVLAFLPATVGKNDAVRFGAAIFTAPSSSSCVISHSTAPQKSAM